MQLLRASAAVPASHGHHHCQLPNTLFNAPILAKCCQGRDKAGGAGGREAPAGTSADQHPPSQQHTASVVQAAEQPVSTAWTGKDFHLLHKTGKGPALTVPGGREERMNRTRAQAQIRSEHVIVPAWSLRGCDTNSPLAVRSKEFCFNF